LLSLRESYSQGRFRAKEAEDARGKQRKAEKLKKTENSLGSLREAFDLGKGSFGFLEDRICKGRPTEGFSVFVVSGEIGFHGNSKA
jgi:hypothetical protein